MSVSAADVDKDLEPKSARDFYDLSRRLTADGKHREALESIQRAVALDDSIAEYQRRLARCYQSLGQLQMAVEVLRAAVEINRADIATQLQLGVALQATGAIEEAGQIFELVQKCRPELAEPHFDLGNVRLRQGRAADAERCFRNAIRLKPDLAEAYNNLGGLLVAQSKRQAAVACFKQALRNKPGDPQILNNLGVVLTEGGLFPEAIRYFEHCIQRNKRFCQAYNNLGVALMKQGHFPQALEKIETALEIEPAYVDAHVNRSSIWLTLGDFERGWKEYEWRLKALESKGATAAPLWTGDSLEGRTILVHCEQGMGDSFQFVRYLPLVKKRGGRVMLKCPAALSTILGQCSGIDQLISDGAELPPYDVQVSLMSLPMIFGTRLETIPRNSPYLSVDVNLVEHWKQKLSWCHDIKVGICWQGNPNYRLDLFRSIPLAEFLPLGRWHGVRLFSLQTGPGIEQLELVDDPCRPVPLNSSADDGGAFVDTAAIMKNLDLVITVDTALAHLAGALGVPVWVALSAAPDWRWFIDREDSPWYPTMRLFRQHRSESWSAVFTRMALELRKHFQLKEPTADSSQSYLGLATRYAQSGDLREAQLWYQRALDITPQDPHIWHRAGVNQHLLRNYREAERLLLRAIRLHPRSADFHNDLAAIYAAQGQLAEAASCLRKSLMLDASSTKVLLNLGLVLESQTQHDEAIAAYRQVLKLDARCADAYLRLGALLHRKKNTKEAWQCYSLAVQLNPRLCDAWSRMAVIARAGKRWQEAAACYLKLIEIDGRRADAYYGLGTVRQLEGKMVEAIECFRTALRLQPSSPEVRNNLGCALLLIDKVSGPATPRSSDRPVNVAAVHNRLGSVLQGQDRLEEAVANFREALAVKPNFVEALNNLGCALRGQKKFDEAIDCHQEVIRLKPGFAAAHTNLGNVLMEQGHFDDAIGHHRRALAIAPNSCEAHYNLGATLEQKGLLDEALVSYDRAIDLKPNHADAHFNRSLIWLTKGDFIRGWPEYGWRMKCKAHLVRPFDRPRWDGSQLEQETLLLHAEQGLGDTLQLVRFVRLAQQRVKQVVVEVQAALIPILTQSGFTGLVARDAPLPAFDVHASLFDLPALFGTVVESIPAEIPYVFADPTLVEHWRPNVASLDGFKVGINWQGNPGFKFDHLRSIPLAEFKPLAQVPGIRLLNLQKGPGLAQLTEDVGFEVATLGVIDEANGAFSDTAAIMKHLDLVVTSDTALAHLAGALGVPVWLALSHSSEWRWLRDRDESPWYPSMRLFRQSRPGDWQGVFQQMASRLTQLRDRGLWSSACSVAAIAD